MIDAQQILNEVPPALQGAMTRRLLELRAAGQSIVVTVLGEEAPTIAIDDDEVFEQFLALVERIETTDAVRAGIQFFADGGRGVDLNDALAELRRNHDCSVGTDA